MGLFRIHLLRDETKAFPNPEDMRIDRKRLPPQPKEEEAMDGLGTDPFESPEGLLDLSRPHLGQRGEA